MLAEGVNLLQFRIRFLEHRKFDVAMGGAQMHLIGTFKGHGDRTI
jgi:hypothetical protein